MPSEILYPVGCKPPWPHSNRGVHLLASPYHWGWLGDEEKRSQWLPRLRAMHITWVLMGTSGMSALEEFDGLTAAEWVLQNQMVPVFRDFDVLNGWFRNEAFVQEVVPIFKRYQMRPIVIDGNEIFDDREWRQDTAPDNAAEHFMERWKASSQLILKHGGIPGFPDPLGEWPWFFNEMRDLRWMWEEGLACFTGHFYGKARPQDYPEDGVSLHGWPMTQDGLRDALDDYYDNPAFNDVPLDRMNRYRTHLADPDKTFLDDSTCFGAWRNVRYYAQEILGCDIPLCMTEGGWVPRDRPGTGDDIDDRWPQTTPIKVAEKTYAMFEGTDHGMFALTPWLLANSWMGGTGGWEDDSWFGGSFHDKYGFGKPVTGLLAANPPQLIDPNEPDSPKAEIQREVIAIRHRVETWDVPSRASMVDF